MQSATNRFAGKIAMLTVSIGALDVMLSASVPVAVDAAVDPASVAHIEVLLARHDVRYALDLPGNANCHRNSAEHSK
jgi:hypothetical protein